MMDIGDRVAKGAMWMIGVRLTDRGIGFISTMVLARLLVPADFGLVAMATVLLGIIEVLGSFSFDLALIQRQNAERRHFDTAWTYNIIVGAASALAMVLAAKPASRF